MVTEHTEILNMLRSNVTVKYGMLVDKTGHNFT